MKFENYLSLKKALRIAMPCLALSFFASCSNEEATGTSNETISPVTNLTLTATVPVAKQSFSTRIGIDDKLISDNASVEEPYVWIEGETLTLYWKNLHDSKADMVIKFVVSNVTADRKGCTMEPVGNPTIDNGFYKIHSLSPHTEFNFVDGELSATIDLGNQNQPSGAVDHSYLSDKLYQYATTVVQVYDGEIISGTTNLPFEFITSLMRVRVVNNTGLPIDVSKVSLSYATEDNPQFYSKGIFTANPLKGPHDYAQAEGATLNALSVTTEQELAVGASFDVYMSFFPTEGYAPGSTETLNMVVDYTVQGVPGVMTRTSSVLNLAFNTGHLFLKFDGGDRYLLTLSITETDLPADVMTPITDPFAVSYDQVVSYKGYSYTWNQINSSTTINFRSGDHIFLSYDKLETACPDGWQHVNTSIANSLYIDAGFEFYHALHNGFFGAVSYAGLYLHSGYFFTPITADLAIGIKDLSELTIVEPVRDELWLRPICRKLE
jgi:hypothetical protein